MSTTQSPPAEASKLSLAQAATFLGISPHTLRAWTYQQRIPFHKVGRRIVFARADLTAFLDARRVPAREDAR